MTKVLEFGGFIAVAAIVHAGFWTAFPQGGGAPAGGMQGASDMTLEASNAQIETLVEAWTRPVSLMQETPTPSLPEPTQTEISAPAPLSDTSKPLPDVPAKPMMLASLSPDLPSVDSTPAAPPAMAEPQPSKPTPPKKPVAEASPKAPAKKKEDTKAKPADRAQSASLARAKETARGNGKEEAGGNKPKSGANQLSDAATANIMAQWGGAIRSRIERQKRYPNGTNASGTVQLTLTVSGNGQLMAVNLRKSSGNSFLDQAAINAVQKARLPAKPKDLPGESHRFNLPIAFHR